MHLVKLSDQDPKQDSQPLKKFSLRNVNKLNRKHAEEHVRSVCSVLPASGFKLPSGTKRPAVITSDVGRDEDV